MLIDFATNLSKLKLKNYTRSARFDFNVFEESNWFVHNVVPSIINVCVFYESWIIFYKVIIFMKLFDYKEVQVLVWNICLIFLVLEL
jgi:hypothetical protein